MTHRESPGRQVPEQRQSLLTQLAIRLRATYGCAMKSSAVLLAAMIATCGMDASASLVSGRVTENATSNAVVSARMTLFVETDTVTTTRSSNVTR